MLRGGVFSHGGHELFAPLVDALLRDDPYLVMADYRPCVDCQADVSRAWGDTGHWTRMSVLNVTRSGRFSSDRAVREYAEEIWAIRPLSIAVSR